MNTRRNTLRLSLGLALSAIAAAAALLAAPATAVAQGADAWPSRPIKLIVPYAAGGFADTRARKIADKIGQSLGQPIVIDNRGGAGGVTGTDAIAKATDGHTFGFGSPGPLVTNPMLMKKLPYNAARDLQPIILIEEAPLILTTAPNQPFQDRGRAGGCSQGQAGHADLWIIGRGRRPPPVGRAAGLPDAHGHGPCALQGRRAGSHRPDGRAPGLHCSRWAMRPCPPSRGDKVKALAVSSKQRLKVLPSVPTLDEAGIKGFESYNWLGMIAPASTPPAVIERLNKAVNEALKDAEVRAMIENTGGMVMGGTPQAYGKFIEAERAKWGPVIKNANITLD